MIHWFAHRWFQLLLFNISKSIYQVFLCSMNNLHITVWFQMWQHPCQLGEPHYISFLKPLMAIRSDCLVVSLTSDPGHYTFLYRYAKHNWEGGRKEKTNKHGLGLASSARKGKSVTLCILWANVSVYSNEIVTSYLQCWHLALVNPASVGQQVLAVVFLTSVDSLLCPTSVFSLPPSSDCVILCTAISSQLFSSALRCQLLCLLSDLPSLLYFWSRGRSHPQALCVGFMPKETKRSSEWCQHKWKQIAMHCVTQMT